MTNEIIVQPQQNDLIAFDDSQVALIKRTIAEGATDDELDLFMYQCKRTGLDPLARQIHFQKFVSKSTGKAHVSFITTIDGYRLIASRTGLYAGNSEPVFDGRVSITDMGKYDKIDSAPAKATVTVKRFVNGSLCEFSASTYWVEYYPGGKKGHMWRKMPHVMLAKCAEASALRKAFPADLSGVYTDDEMGQAAQPVNSEFEQHMREMDRKHDPSPDVVIVEEKPVTDAMRKRIHALGNEKYGKEWNTKRPLLCLEVSEGNTNSSKELDYDETVALAELLKS